MTVRAPKNKTEKQVSAVGEKYKDEDKRLLPFYRKENVRLQNLIAKNQVAHESEINRIRAEAAEKIKRSFKIVIGSTHGESSDYENKKS